MLKITEDHWEVETVQRFDDRKLIQVKITERGGLSTFEANRLARALQLAADHLETT